MFGRLSEDAVDADGPTREDAMPIWELKPIDAETDAWRGSKHRDTVIVRAETVWEAREVANAAFGVETVSLNHRTTPLKPWIHASLTTCRQLTTKEFDEHGPSGVLVPAGQVFGFGRM